MSTSRNRRGKSRVPLSRDRVLAAAIELADEDGLEKLTMRKLGEALGVEAMALYNHVDNKGDLVDAMVDRVVGEIELPAEGDWEVAIRTCAVSAHDVFLRHPWACGPAMGPGNSRAARTSRLAYIEWLLRRLTEAGFPPELTYRGYHALDSHILGFTMWQLGHRSAATAILARTDDAAEFAANLARELRAGDFPHLATHLEQHLEAPSDDGEREFEFGLDLILDGLVRARDDAS